MLVALTAAMLIWGAFHPAVRDMVLVVVGVSKLGFVALVLRVPAFRKKAIVPIIVDLTLVALFGLYLAVS